MKKLSPLLCSIFLSACIFDAFGQTEHSKDGADIDSYALGSQTVRIPTPEGYTEAFARFARIAGRISATEAPGLETLAVHLPNSLIRQIEKGKDPDLDFYTKVSVNKQLRSQETTNEMFASIVAALEKNFESYLDPNGPLMKSVVKNADKGLSERYGRDAGVDVSQIKSLGYFDKQTDVFSAMTVSDVQVFGKRRTMLSSISIVNANKRLLYIYVYKRLSDDGDVERLRDFTKKWTAAIIAANK